ncbi:MAG: hypothetical protein ACYCS7_13680 [Acidimicrobiales bacterium]
MVNLLLAALDETSRRRMERYSGALPGASDLAYAIVALYLGVEMLSHLSGERVEAESLLGMVTRFSGVLGGVRRLQGTSEGER